MKTYFAIVHKDRDSAVGVVFPDLPGCFSAGDTFDKAIANAHVALKLYAAAELDAGRRLPKPRTFEALYRDREVREESKGAPFIGIRLDAEKPTPARTMDPPLGKAEGSKRKHTISRDRRDVGSDVRSKKRVRRTG